MELADTLVLGTSAFWHESSSLSSATKILRAPVADGEATGFQTQDSRFESVQGCQGALAELADAAASNAVNTLGSSPRSATRAG